MTARNLFSAALVFVLSACSHPIEIVGSGDVWSTGGRTCSFEDHQEERDNCTENYVVDAYQETYYAEARPGWFFSHWENYCTDSEDNSCSFDVEARYVTAFFGITVPPLVAVFDPETGGIPQSEVIVVEGVPWAQPDLFTGLSWDDIMAACPDGVCGPGSSLSGHNMNGWQLASPGEVNALFNAYVGDCMLDTRYQDYLELTIADAWGHRIFDAGFRHTIEYSWGLAVMGWTNDGSLSDRAYYAMMRDVYVDNGNFLGDAAGTHWNASLKDTAGNTLGAWFYRTPLPIPGVPITDTVTADGVEWAQVDLFNNVEVSAMGGACPSGVCEGILNGYVMDGWYRAGAAQVEALFDHYRAIDEFPCDPSGCVGPPWYRAWLADGWRPTRERETGVETYGFTSDSIADGRIGAYQVTYPWGTVTQYSATTIGGIAFVPPTNRGECWDTAVEGAGGWFYRPAP